MEPFRPLEFFDLDDFFHRALFSVDEPVWLALKKLSAYLKTLSLGVIEGHIEQGAFLIHPETISIGKGSVVESGAYIKGPCVIGENCEVRHGAYLRGNVLTGSHCVIGHATELKNAIFLNGAHAGHFAYVGDSILGKKVNLGAGVKCANLRFDGKTVRVGKKIDSSLRKFGAILGDHVQLGCNSVTNPGTLIGKGSLCYPCICVEGIIPPLTTVKKNVI